MQDRSTSARTAEGISSTEARRRQKNLFITSSSINRHADKSANNKENNKYHAEAFAFEVITERENGGKKHNEIKNVVHHSSYPSIYVPKLAIIDSSDFDKKDSKSRKFEI